MVRSLHQNLYEKRTRARHWGISCTSHIRIEINEILLMKYVQLLLIHTVPIRMGTWACNNCTHIYTSDCWRKEGEREKSKRRTSYTKEQHSKLKTSLIACQKCIINEHECVCEFAHTQSAKQWGCVCLHNFLCTLRSYIPLHFIIYHCHDLHCIVRKSAHFS